MALSELVDGLHVRLAARGWDDVRRSYGYVLLALRDAPRTTTELGARLGMTKQAASKLLDGMEAAGYVRRHSDRRDARAKLVRSTAKGARLLADVEAIYVELESGWAAILGESELERIRRELEQVVRAGHDGALPPVRPAV